MTDRNSAKNLDKAPVNNIDQAPVNILQINPQIGSNSHMSSEDLSPRLIATVAPEARKPATSPSRSPLSLSSRTVQDRKLENLHSTSYVALPAPLALAKPSSKVKDTSLGASTLLVSDQKLNADYTYRHGLLPASSHQSSPRYSNIDLSGRQQEEQLGLSARVGNTRNQQQSLAAGVSNRVESGVQQLVYKKADLPQTRPDLPHQQSGVQQLIYKKADLPHQYQEQKTEKGSSQVQRISLLSYSHHEDQKQQRRYSALPYSRASSSSVHLRNEKPVLTHFGKGFSPHGSRQSRRLIRYVNQSGIKRHVSRSAGKATSNRQQYPDPAILSPTLMAATRKPHRYVY